MKRTYHITSVFCLVFVAMLLSACGGGSDSQPTPDVDATIAAQVQATLAASQPTLPATATPVPVVDVNATVQAVVEMTLQAQPTQTPEPTTTATEKATATVTPTETSPTLTPTPTPDTRLFWDDFETGIRPEWGMLGNFGLVNGNFVVDKQYFEGYLGDQNWDDYSVTLDLEVFSGFQLPLRIQDQDNYMMFDNTFAKLG